MKNLLILLWLFCPNMTAYAVQDHAQLRAEVLDFVQQQTARLPGQANVQVDEIDPRLVLADCPHHELFLPAGSRLIGKTAVGVRCQESHGWRILVPAQITLNLDLLVSTHPIAMGSTLRASDLSTQSMAVEHTSGLTDARLAIGKIARYSLMAGQVLRADMLRDPYSVTQGQVVKLTWQSQGLSIRGDGVALNNASVGESASVRTPSGRVISGRVDNDGAIYLTP